MIYQLQSSQPQSGIGVGVAVIIVFFVVLFCGLCASYTFFRIKRKRRKNKKLEQQHHHHQLKGPRQETTGFTNNALDLQEQQHGYGGAALNNAAVAAQQPQPQQARYPLKMRTPHRPDLLVGGESPYRDLVNPSPAGAAAETSNGLFPENAEHYDIENASSIAPSDIDVVYHYKGYRDGGVGAGGTGGGGVGGAAGTAGRHHRRSGGSKSLTGSKGRRSRQQLNNTPLARLSPSSEMSHNPRILHLGDLSGKSLPPGLLVEQSERSLNSPVSHVSSNSRHSHHHNHRGLTSENVARFNSSQSPHHGHHHHSGGGGHKSPSLLNSLDVLQSGGGGGDGGSSSNNRRRNNRSASRFSDRKTPLSHAGGDGASSPSSSSSSSDGGDDDSFTCSEYEYDGTQVNSANDTNGITSAKDVSVVADASSGMIFSSMS